MQKRNDSQNAVSAKQRKLPRKHQPTHKNEPSAKKPTFIPSNTTQLATQKILEKLAHLEIHYSKRFFSPKSKKHFDTLLSSIKSSPLPFSGDILTDHLKVKF